MYRNTLQHMANTYLCITFFVRVKTEKAPRRRELLSAMKVYHSKRTQKYYITFFINKKDPREESFLRRSISQKNLEFSERSNYTTIYFLRKDPIKSFT